MENITFELNKAHEHINFLSQLTNEKLKAKLIEPTEADTSSQISSPLSPERIKTSKTFQSESPTNSRKVSDHMQQTLTTNKEVIAILFFFSECIYNILPFSNQQHD